MSEQRARYTTPRDRRIITRAVALLDSGLLVTALPAKLMAEFDLTPGKARRLATMAVQRRRGER